MLIAPHFSRALASGRRPYGLRYAPRSEDEPSKERVRRAMTPDDDALSKNITLILEDLLKDYDKTERPAFATGEPTRVRINILIRSMGPISEEDMVGELAANMTVTSAPFVMLDGGGR